MAALTVTEVQPVATVLSRLKALLDQANSLRAENAVAQPLPSNDLLAGVNALHHDIPEKYDQPYKWNVVESAARELFYSSIINLDIEDPKEVRIWHLYDILLLCGDQSMCAPDLVCLLIEELLDCQTTTSCRIVFDYLESRRERLAQKDFQKKSLVFLRSCNELLRRLSRAEDAIFCGRVFFFLFLTFPLGDRSSVNLRGEFHTENTTKFEVSETSLDTNSMQKVSDADALKADAEASKATTPQPSGKPGSRAVPIKQPPKKAPEAPILSNSELYPIFWRLQQDFSDPTRLFATENLKTFKDGLAKTIAKFTKTEVVQTKTANDSKRGQKRKLGHDRSDGPESGTKEVVDNYNPKYLTSRDLFDLELSDLAFQRHILVQALILIDFLLSLTDKSKQRLPALDDKKRNDVIFGFTLGEKDTEWAVATKSTINTYLQSTWEGKLFARMVETVLARDKNWIRWKIESCPSIVRQSVSTASELEARQGAKKASVPRRVPARPNGAMNLSFLNEGTGSGLEALKDPSRYTGPTIDELLGGLKGDELDLDMAMDDEEKAGLENAIANKRWKILREARATRLGVLDKVEIGKSLDAVFQAPVEVEMQDAMPESPMEPPNDENKPSGGTPDVVITAEKEQGHDHAPEVMPTDITGKEESAGVS